MDNKKLVIFGIGEQAEVASFLFTHDSEYEVEAFCVDRAYIGDQENFQGKPVVAFEDIEKLYPASNYSGFVAIGYNKMNDLRKDKYISFKKKGYELASYISSKAITWPDFNYGDNALILEGNNIQPFVKIGSNVTLWSGNHIGHHTVIEDNVFLTSHVVVSGGVIIGENSFLGVNATIRDHIKIGKYSLVASGALLSKSTEDYGVYIGVPAKKKEVKSHELEI